MSNNNLYWGTKYGFFDPSIPKGQNFARGPTFRARQWSSGANRNAPAKHKPDTAQSRADRELYRLRGQPVMFVKNSSSTTPVYIR